MTSSAHLDTLRDLNRNYIRSVEEADVTWFDAHLADDFHNTNPDGTLIDRVAFLAQIGRGSAVKDIREHDVKIRLLGDFAIIHARTTYRKPDGSTGAGRGSIEVIDESTFRLTIVDNGHESYRGLVRVYRRKPVPQLSEAGRGRKWRPPY